MVSTIEKSPDLVVAGLCRFDVRHTLPWTSQAMGLLDADILCSCERRWTHGDASPYEEVDAACQSVLKPREPSSMQALLIYVQVRPPGSSLVSRDPRKESNPS